MLEIGMNWTNFQIIGKLNIYTGFPLIQEIMENLEKSWNFVKFSKYLEKC